MVLSKRGKIVVFIIAGVLLILSVLNLLDDIDFFIFKTVATAHVLTIRDKGIENPYRIEVEYFNEKSGKNDTCGILIKNDFDNNFSKGNFIKVIYANNWPRHMFMLNHGNPRPAILIFDIISVLIMYFSASANKWW